MKKFMFLFADLCNNSKRFYFLNILKKLTINWCLSTTYKNDKN